MPALRLALTLPLLALRLAADDPAPAPPATLAHEAVKDIKYAPPARSPMAPPAPDFSLADAPLSLSPYIVRELPDRTYFQLNDSIRQRKRLQSSPALYSKGGLQLVLPPFLEMYTPPGRAHPDAVPRLNWTLLRFRW